MKDFLGRFEDILSGIAMGIAVVATFINVVFRYCFSSPIYQAEEIATSAFVWLVFIGSSACFKENMHIGIDCLVNLFPRKVRCVIAVFSDIVLFCISVTMAYMAFIIAASAQTRTSALRIPYTFIDAAAVLGFIGMALHIAGSIVRDFKALKNPETVKGGDV